MYYVQYRYSLGWNIRDMIMRQISRQKTENSIFVLWTILSSSSRLVRQIVFCLWTHLVKFSTMFAFEFVYEKTDRICITRFKQTTKTITKEKIQGQKRRLLFQSKLTLKPVLCYVDDHHNTLFFLNIFCKLFAVYCYLSLIEVFQLQLYNFSKYKIGVCTVQVVHSFVCVFFCRGRLLTFVNLDFVRFNSFLVFSC